MISNIIKQLIIICLLGIGLSACDPDEAFFGPFPTMEISSEAFLEFNLIREEYKDGRITNKKDKGAYFPLSTSYAYRDSVPNLNFEEWFPKVMAEIDSIVIRTQDNSIKRVWRKEDVFKENERHVYNINYWTFNDLHNVWRYEINWEDLK